MNSRYYPNNYFTPVARQYHQFPPCMRSAQAYGYPSIPAEDNRLGDSWTFGPLKIEWNFDGESLKVIFKMFEDVIQDILLTLSKPNISFSLTLGNATISMMVKADFIQKQLSITGALCVDTTCTTFNNTLVATW